MKHPLIGRGPGRPGPFVLRAAITWGATAVGARALFAVGDYLPPDSPMFFAYSFVAVLYGLTAAIVIVLALPGPDPWFLAGNGVAAGLGVALVNARRPADINDATRVSWFVLTAVAIGGSLVVATLGYGMARHLARQRTARGAERRS